MGARNYTGEMRFEKKDCKSVSEFIEELSARGYDAEIKQPYVCRDNKMKIKVRHDRVHFVKGFHNHSTHFSRSVSDLLELEVLEKQLEEAEFAMKIMSFPMTETELNAVAQNSAKIGFLTREIQIRRPF